MQLNDRQPNDDSWFGREVTIIEPKCGVIRVDPKCFSVSIQDYRD